jgi:hypothetical protein
MASKKPIKSKTRKPLTISIHGDGIDIDAKFDSTGKPDKSNGQLDTVIRQLIESFTVKVMPPPLVEQPAAQGHDFDVVKSVIDHGSAEVLQAIVDLANAQLEQRRAAQS